MVLGEVKRTFNPEFINRIDEIIVFEALTDEDLRRIMALLVDQLNANLADRRMKIQLTPEVIDWIIDVTCKDRSCGARLLRRAIQRYVEDPLSEELIRGNLHDGEVEVYLEGGQLAYRPAGVLTAGRRRASGPQITSKSQRRQTAAGMQGAGCSEHDLTRFLTAGLGVLAPASLSIRWFDASKIL